MNEYEVDCQKSVINHEDVVKISEVIQPFDSTEALEQEAIESEGEEKEEGVDNLALED